MKIPSSGFFTKSQKNRILEIPANMSKTHLCVKQPNSLCSMKKAVEEESPTAFFSFTVIRKKPKNVKFEN